MALPDERVGQVSNSPRGKRIPPSHLTKQFSGPLIQIRDAVQLTGLSRSEFKKRMLDGIYPSVLDEETGWRWIPKLDLLEIIASDPTSLENSNIGSANHSKSESKTSSQEKAAGKKPAHSHPRQASGNQGKSAKPAFLYTGTTAQIIFMLLREGKSIADIVIEKGIHPDVVHATANKYAELSGGLFLSSDEKKLLEEFMLAPVQMKTGAEIVTLAKKNAAARITCTQCFAHAAGYCESCVTAFVREAVTRATAAPGGAPGGAANGTSSNGVNENDDKRDRGV
jgi:hypothetical protein